MGENHRKTPELPRGRHGPNMACAHRRGSGVKRIQATSSTNMVPIINGGHIRLKCAGIKGLPDHLLITSPSGAIGRSTACSARIVISTHVNRGAAVR